MREPPPKRISPPPVNQNAPTASKLRFVQIAASVNELFALDANGRVYKYVPAREEIDGPGVRFAFWSQLTDHKPKDHKPKE